MSRLVVGCHLSAARGWAAMGRDAVSVGATTLAFFTRSPRGGRMRKLDAADAAELRRTLAEHGFGTVVAHAPYTMNLCSGRPSAVEFARQALREDLERMEELPGSCYNLHPGCHVGQGVAEGVRLICEGLNEVLEPGQSTCVLLETMAGKGSEVGRSFEELAQIIDGVEHDELVGVCLDTCHVSDAGYDIAADLDGVLAELDRTVGLGRLRALHLNDSKGPVGCHRDRHERIGQGTLGLETFRRLVSDERLAHLPMVLETPQDDLAGWADEIRLLREMAGEGA